MRSLWRWVVGNVLSPVKRVWAFVVAGLVAVLGVGLAFTRMLRSRREARTRDTMRKLVEMSREETKFNEDVSRRYVEAVERAVEREEAAVDAAVQRHADEVERIEVDTERRVREVADAVRADPHAEAQRIARERGWRVVDSDD